MGKAGGQITLYRKREPVRTIAQEQGVQALIELLKEDGVWVEPAGQPSAQRLSLPLLQP